MAQTRDLNNPLAANVEYGYGLGCSFTPVSGKRPILKNWQQQPRETLEEALAWARQGNVGLRTGQASGIVVIDVDPGADISRLDLPPTVRANTGRPGAFHLYYRCAVRVGNSSGRLGPHIDVRGDGGQVVYPGSVYPDTDRRYEWAKGLAPWEVEIAELPAHILQRLNGHDVAVDVAHVGPTRPRAANAGRYAQAALDGELDALRTAPEGERNNTLNTAAFSLGTLIGGGHLDRQQVEDSLRAVAASIGLDSRETEATIRSGIESGIRQPRQVEREGHPAVPRARPEYILTPGAHKDDHGRYTEQSNATFADTVLERLPDDSIYRKDFIPGELLGPPGKRRWVEFTPDRMRIVVDTHVRLGKWVTSRKTNEQVMVYQACSKDASGIVIAQARQMPKIRELALMVEYPVYGPGFKRVPPGWHDGIFYDEPEDLRNLAPETDGDVIHDVLQDLIIDFPFKGEADRQNYFGLMLTPTVAPALDGNRPMHLVNSPLERTGKTKLVNEVYGGVLLGREVPSMQITNREEEREKRILAMLLQGETLMHLDNLPHYVDSQSLASLLTAHIFGGRILGLSRTAKLPNNLTIVGTGNNVQASGEIAKRIVPILIEPTSAHPEARADFHHPDIRAYVRERRRLVLACLLGLVENWIAAGKPKHANRLGGFEHWSETVGGILQVNGFREWRTNEAQWRTLADTKGQEMEAFVKAWHEAYGSQEVEPKQLRGLAERHDLFGHVLAKPTERAISVAFGRMLLQHTDMPVGNCFIRRSTKGNNAKYRLDAIV